MAPLVWRLSVLFVWMCCMHNGEAEVLNQKDDEKYNSCDEILRSGLYKSSGGYVVFLNTTKPFEVYCHFELGIAYTSIMQQKYGRVNFQRPMVDYVNGFGSELSGDFWGGLYKMKYLTDSGHRVLTITMQDWNNVVKRIQYRSFMLYPDYRLAISQYVSGGILPDDFSHNNGQLFATYDRPDINGCAGQQKAGWWYNYCTYALPTGHYYLGGPYHPSGQFYDGIYFNDWHGFGYSLKYIKLEVSYT